MSNNVLLGYQAGTGVTTGSNNIVIGNQSANWNTEIEITFRNKKLMVPNNLNDGKILYDIEKDGYGVKVVGYFQFLKVLIQIQKIMPVENSQEILKLYAKIIEKYKNKKSWENMNMYLEEIILVDI